VGRTAEPWRGAWQRRTILAFCRRRKTSRWGGLGTRGGRVLHIAQVGRGREDDLPAAAGWPTWVQRTYGHLRRHAQRARTRPTGSAAGKTSRLLRPGIRGESGGFDTTLETGEDAILPTAARRVAWADHQEPPAPESIPSRDPKGTMLEAFPASAGGGREQSPPPPPPPGQGFPPAVPVVRHSEPRCCPIGPQGRYSLGVGIRRQFLALFWAGRHRIGCGCWMAASLLQLRRGEVAGACRDAWGPTVPAARSD